MIPLPNEHEKPLRGFLASEPLYVRNQTVCIQITLTNVAVGWHPFYKHLYFPQSRIILLPSNPRVLLEKYRKSKAMQKASWIKMGKEVSWNIKQPSDLKPGHVFMSNQQTYKVLWQLKELHATLAQQCHNNELATPVGGLCDYGIFFHETDFDEVGKSDVDPARAMLMSNNRLEQAHYTREREKQKALDRDEKILTSGPAVAPPSRFKTTAAVSDKKSPRKSPAKRTVSTRSDKLKEVTPPPPAAPPRSPSAKAESEAAADQPPGTPTMFDPEPSTGLDPMTVFRSYGMDEATLATALLSLLGKKVIEPPSQEAGPSTAPDTSDMLEKMLEQQKKLMSDFEERHKEEMRETKEAIENATKAKQQSDNQVLELTQKLKIQEQRNKASSLLIGKQTVVPPPAENEAAQPSIPEEPEAETKETEIARKQRESAAAATSCVVEKPKPPRSKKTTTGSFEMPPEGGSYYYGPTKSRRVHYQYLAMSEDDPLKGKCYECYRSFIQYKFKDDWFTATQIQEIKDEDALVNLGKSPDFIAKSMHIDEVIQTVRRQHMPKRENLTQVQIPKLRRKRSSRSENIIAQLQSLAAASPAQPNQAAATEAASSPVPVLVKKGSGRRKSFKEVNILSVPPGSSAQEGLDHYRFVRGQLEDLIAEIEMEKKMTPNTMIVLARSQKSLIEIKHKIFKRKNLMTQKGMEIERETEDEEVESDEDWDKDEEFVSAEEMEQERQKARVEKQKLKEKLEKKQKQKEQREAKRKEDRRLKEVAKEKEAENQRQQKILLEQLKALNPALALQLDPSKAAEPPAKKKKIEPETVEVSDDSDDGEVSVATDLNESPPLDEGDQDLSLFIPANFYPLRGEFDPLVIQNRWKQFFGDPKKAFRFAIGMIQFNTKEAGTQGKDALFRGTFYKTLNSLIRTRNHADYTMASIQATLTNHQNKLAALSEAPTGGMRGVYNALSYDKWFRDVLLQTALYCNVPDSYTFYAQCKDVVTRAYGNYAVANSRKKKPKQAKT